MRLIAIGLVLAAGLGCGAPGMSAHMDGPVNSGGPISVTQNFWSTWACTNRGCTHRCFSGRCGITITTVGLPRAEARPDKVDEGK